MGEEVSESPGLRDRLEELAQETVCTVCRCSSAISVMRTTRYFAWMTKSRRVHFTRRFLLRTDLPTTAASMSSPGRQQQQGQQANGATVPRSSSPLAFPTSSPRPAANGSPARQQVDGQQQQNGLNVPNGVRNAAAARSSSPLMFPTSSPARVAPSAGQLGAVANGSSADTPRAGSRVAPLFAPASATRTAADGHERAGSHPSSEPLFFPSSATPKTRRTRGDIHSSLPISPSPLRRQRDGAAEGAPSSSAPEGPARARPAPPSSNAGGRLGAPPSLSNVGPSSDALEDQDRNQGARTVIWNTAVGLDETMSSFKGFLQDFKAKYRTEYARKQGKPEAYTPSSNPDKLVYEQ